MRVLIDKVFRDRTVWWIMVMIAMAVVEVTSLSGANVCMVKQKFNVTKRVKYRAPMTVRTYEWCLAMPPRCSKWTTEMKDLTRLETEERTAETAVCCPGYTMYIYVYCIPICPHGKTGAGCLEDCPPNKWGPNCVNDCKICDQGVCSPITGECLCHSGWEGESCETSLSTTTTPGAMMESLTTATAKPSASTKPYTLPIPTTLVTTTSPSITPNTTLTTPTVKLNTTIPTIKPSTIPTEYTTLNRMPEYISTEEFSTDTEANFNKSNVFIDSTTAIPKNRSHFTSAEATNQRLSTISYKTDTSESNANMETPLAKETAKSTKPTLLKSTILTTDRSVSSTEAMSTESFKTSSETNYRDKQETVKRTESTVKPTTTKFKPKEIWIRPAQKGDHFEIKTKNLETKAKVNEAEVTTPKTIVVSIIPTSVSYATFKRIALTTASFMSLKRSSSARSYLTTEKEPVTVPNIHSTKTPFHIKIQPKTTFTTPSPQKSTLNETKTSHTTLSLQEIKPKETQTQRTVTNSMASEKLTSYSLTTTSNVHNLKATSQNISSTVSPKTTLIAQNSITEHSFSTKQHKNVSLTEKQVRETNNERVLTDSNSNDAPVTKYPSNDAPVTKDPLKVEETFHILTEPEHITAVMSDKGNERSTVSVDLISVISIAGGVMMAIITVAVVIVMVERCKKPRYEDDRKYNEIRMQVMEDNDVDNMPPPPYVRSIFHTPLPDPPAMEKCHYQPISTLDRNLKQFMRPVVVQTISPLMLENFRGILECHYDHLPRRSHDCDSMQMRCSITPSIDECTELLPKRASSLTSSTIDAMKCEATLDVIDTTTSEPLYAEIPCWRPSFEHAVEVVNLNGEAVTEL